MSRALALTAYPEEASLTVDDGFLIFRGSHDVTVDMDESSSYVFEAGRVFTLTLKLSGRFTSTEIAEIAMSRYSDTRLTATINLDYTVVESLLRNRKSAVLGLDVTDNQRLCYGILHSCPVYNPYYRP